MAEQGRLGRAFDAFDRLSGREKLMVSGLALALLSTAVIVVWMIVGNQISELEQRNAQTRETLDQVIAQKDTYLRQKARLDAYKKKLDENKLRLVREMEREATKLGITIEDFKERKTFLTENHRRAKARPGATQTKKKVIDLVEESQTVTIRKVSLDALSRFMSAMESRPEPVKVTQLNINTLASDRQVLREVRMTVATYRNEEVEL